MPYKDRSAQNAWRKNHPEISRRYRREHPEQNKKTHRDSDSKRRYGFVSYEEMLRARNRSCMICGKKAKKMCIDHEGPATVFNGTYRGILCQQCNTRLGWFERFRKRILRYLKNASRVGSTTSGNGDC